jgi:hypothetical protein
LAALRTEKAFRSTGWVLCICGPFQWFEDELERAHLLAKLRAIANETVGVHTPLHTAYAVPMLVGSGEGAAPSAGREGGRRRPPCAWVKHRIEQGQQLPRLELGISEDREAAFGEKGGETEAAKEGEGKAEGDGLSLRLGASCTLEGPAALWRETMEHVVLVMKEDPFRELMDLIRYR